jgi:hypothetical protein
MQCMLGINTAGAYTPCRPYNSMMLTQMLGDVDDAAESYYMVSHVACKCSLQDDMIAEEADSVVGNTDDRTSGGALLATAASASESFTGQGRT